MLEDNSFSDVLSSNKILVWDEIDKYLDQFFKYPAFCDIPKKYTSLLEFHKTIVSEYPERKGKYFRPTLVMLTAQSMGFTQEKAIKTAAAMQVSEDWILCHDDIEDDSPDRRGKPTLHKIYGVNLAINAGDALHLMMWKMINDNHQLLGSDLATKISNEFFWMLNRTMFGQGSELKWAQENNFNLTYDDVEFILASKTGYYTIAGPMRLGAILSGANEIQLNTLYDFGVTLGKVYQIIDDLLDLTSDFSGLKKIKGNDIFENKKTIMLVHLLKSANKHDLKLIFDILAKNRYQKTQSEVNQIIKLMNHYGSLAFAKQKAITYSHQLKDFFNKNMDFIRIQPYRNQIIACIDFITNRKY